MNPGSLTRLPDETLECSCMGIWNNIKKNNFITKYINLQKNYKIAMGGMLRPSTYDVYSAGFKVYPKFPYNNAALYDLAYNSDTVTSIHNSLRRELFRNGYDLTEAKNKDEEETSSEQEINPEKDKKKILEFLENVNENRQSITEVMMQIEDDFSIMDDGFMIFLNDYEFTDEGEIIPEKTKLREIIRGDPRYMGLIMNNCDRPGYNDDGVMLYTCPVHREQLIEGKDICPVCGAKAYQTFYFSDRTSGTIYFMKDEIVFKSKYRPGTRRGFSPIITSWQKIRTLLFMDSYIMKLYDGQRPPKALLAFKTSNQAGLEKTWSEAKQRAKEDPHLPIVMGIQDSSNGREFVQFIDFMKSLDELQHTEMRNEYRRQIGAVYGVEPIFQGDMSSSGGLNNEGLQLTVTNRAVEYGQGIYNNHFFPAVLNAMGAEGWILALNSNEEQDEMAKLDRQQRSLQNGQLALQLGLEANYDDDSAEVIVKTGDLELMQPENNIGFPDPNFPSEPSGTPGVSAKARPNFSDMSKVLKDKIEEFIKTFKKKPNEEELRKVIAKVNLSLKNELSKKTDGLFKTTYLRESEKIGKELGINITFDNIDRNAINVLTSQKVLTEAYNGIADELTTKLHGIINDAYRDPKGLSVKQITERIKETVDVSDFKAETIARTEISKVSSAARKNSYQKEEDFDTFKFKHIGPADNRTTDTSKRIKNRTKNGVNWSEYVKIVSEESTKDFPDWSVDKDFPTSHYNTRHTFVKL